MLDVAWQWVALGGVAERCEFPGPRKSKSDLRKRKVANLRSTSAFVLRRFVRLSRDHTLPWPPWRWVGMPALCRRNGIGPMALRQWPIPQWPRAGLRKVRRGDKS
eukprot:gene10315-biopygen13657